MVPQFLEAAAPGAPPRGAATQGGAAPPCCAAPDALRLLVLPDHPTPLETRTHAAEPVPFIIWGAGFEPNGATAYTEEAARATGLAVAPGHLLMSTFLG